MRNNCTIFEYVSNVESLKIFVKNKIIPLVVYVDNEKLPKKFNDIYSLEWFDIGKKNQRIFYSIDGDKLVKLIKEKKLIPNYFIFNDGTMKKIDAISPVGYDRNKKIDERKRILRKHNKLDKNCLISCSSDLWLENDFFDFGKASLSEKLIKKYKKENN